MKQPYYFYQLFEKMPNGSYRERQKPVAPLDIYNRHDFVRSDKTGRICVVYPAISWEEAIRIGMVTFVREPLQGGQWGRTDLSDLGLRQTNYGLSPLDPSLTWSGNHD